MAQPHSIPAMHLIFDHDETTAVVLAHVSRFDIITADDDEAQIYAHVGGQRIYLGSQPTKTEAVAWVRSFAEVEGGDVTRGLNA